MYNRCVMKYLLYIYRNGIYSEFSVNFTRATIGLYGLYDNIFLKNYTVFEGGGSLSQPRYHAQRGRDLLGNNARWPPEGDYFAFTLVKNIQALVWRNSTRM